MSKPTQAHDARTCPNCGKKFTPRHKAQRYCTNIKDGPGSCQKMAERERAKQRGRKARKVQMVCHHCGVEFMGEKRKRTKGSREHYYCTHRCYSDYRSWGFRKNFSSQINWRECQGCERPFISKNGRHSCNECRAAKTPAFVSGHCRECGDWFVGAWHPTSPATFCDDSCATRNSRRRYRKIYGRSDQYRKRARRYRVAYEPINRTKVFERDKYVCGICGHRTLDGAKVPEPRAPTLDHILPISLGGPHTYENVQCACFECNWRKGASADLSNEVLVLGLEFPNN